MATHAPTTGAPVGASCNVLPFRRPEDPLAFAPGVPPFDRGNPVHIRAWNTLCALGWAERRAQERSDREGC